MTHKAKAPDLYIMIYTSLTNLTMMVSYHLTVKIVTRMYMQYFYLQINQFLQRNHLPVSYSGTVVQIRCRRGCPTTSRLENRSRSGPALPSSLSQGKVHSAVSRSDTERNRGGISSQERMLVPSTSRSAREITQAHLCYCTSQMFHFFTN